MKKRTLETIRFAPEIEVEFKNTKISDNLIKKHRIIPKWSLDYDGSLESGCEYRPKDCNKLYFNEDSIAPCYKQHQFAKKLEKLFRDFWKDVGFGNVWENKKTQGGAITHQRAMHRLATLPDSNVCANVYEHGDRGKFYNKTCPGGDLHVVVLYSYIGNFDKTPPHVAFYIVLQYWGENTRVILYIVYPAANTTPTMRITNSRLMSQLRDRALAQVRTERSKGQFPAPWMAQGFYAAEMGACE